MPRYQYLAVDPDGRERRGGVNAADEASARADLQRRKLMPVQLAPAGAAPERAKAEPAVRIGGKALSHKMRVVITRQLATLIDAAVPVDEALGMIAEQQEQALAKRVMADVRDGVLEGMRLADALGRHPRSFSPLYRAAVAGGERSGKLGFVLTRLADFLGRTEAMRSKVTTAMVYPAVLSLVAITVVVCLMIFVVPSLAEQFQSFDAQLPLLTQILIGTSSFLSTFWAFILVGLVVGGYLLRIIMRREVAQDALHAALLRAPLIGRWVRDVNASRFARAVSTLAASGLPILDSVRFAKDSVGNRSVARAIAQMATWIEEGDSLSHAMRRSGVVPPILSYMAASGENAGELPSMLEKAADHLDQEFEAFTASALSLLEPAIIVVMGLVVASIVLAIMLPILQLNRLAIG